MKRLRAGKARKPARKKPKEPLAEGIVPLNKRGQRDWKSMSDDEVVGHAKRFMKENGISSRGKLQKADSRLYKALRRRKLLDRVGFEERGRKKGYWESLSDAELVEHARKIMEEGRISGRTELEKTTRGLYHVLWKRKLLDRISFEEKKRDWSLLSDAELVEHARKIMEENDICGRGELAKADSGLYEALRKRKLLDRIGFEEIRRGWSSLSDEQLIGHARQFMRENGISGRMELIKADNGLYIALQRRKLLDRVGFEDKRRKERPWKGVGDDEVVGHAKRFLEENGISGRGELKKADSGLYEVLRKRKLLDKVSFEEKHRDWSSLSDAELVEHARKIMEENDICGRGELVKADRRLYRALRKRKLLDQVFADIEQAKERDEAQALLDVCMEFGGAE